MNLRFAKMAQWYFEVLSLDDMSAIYILGGYMKILEEDWQCAVEFIYRILKCELVDVWPHDILIKGNEYSYDGIEGYCKELANHNPINDTPLVWTSPDITLTEKGQELVNKYLIFDGEYSNKFDVNCNFIEELEKIFDDYGVCWDEQSIKFPINNKPAVPL
ncbi:hypothetical protein [Neisseria sp.]|uniref:hypothetical protein n=1 Tax=Neisseria sp. TaxID=192066 RepID=UPI0026DC8E23|nr:hypothetical protein [Neisseria sp.]MDO4907527.1 hypothetical protein [Neisseria sp.]